MSLSRVLVHALAVLLLAAASPPAPASPQPISAITEGPVKLHYLDFGGHGSPILLLPGMSNTAWVYKDFGLELARKHRVWALTRRGHGESEQPAKGYSLDHLSNDILAFLNAHKVTRVTLIGHSLAGEELTHFARRHPDRVAALVYLDAAYDRQHQNSLPPEPVSPPAMSAADKASPQAFANYIRRTRPDIRRYWSDAVELDVRASVASGPDGSYDWKIGPIFEEYLTATSSAPPDYSAISAPALAIYSVEDESYRAPDGANDAEKAAVIAYANGPLRQWREKSIAQFKAGKGAREVIEIDAGHHLFLHRSAESLRLIEDFLARQGL